MKYDTFEQYPANSLDLPQAALLTTWDCLAEYRNDLVLVGGLAIRYLTRPPRAGLPGPVTLDVDFGVHIAASNGSYAGIRDVLSGHGFKWENKRFVRKFTELTLYLDLLTDDGKSDTGTITPDSSGPLSCAAFRLNNRHRDPALEQESMPIRQQCVTLAQELLA